MKCKEVMTKNPVCCIPEDEVVKAADSMKRLDIGSIPVVDTLESGKLVGILTDRDLAMRVVAEKRDLETTKVKEVMTSKVVACHMDDDMQKAMDVMAEHQLRRLPVVDSGSRIVGIIAQADVATRLDQPVRTAEMVKDISQSKVS